MADNDGSVAFPKIGNHERQCLEVLARHYDSDANCLYFWIIAGATGLTEKQARRAVRSLAQKGLAEYTRGLFDGDGRVAGSGYCCTRLGHDALLTARAKARGETDTGEV